MRVSGCKNHYEFVWSSEVKAKTVTNNLPILSVLGNALLKLSPCQRIVSLKLIMKFRICQDNAEFGKERVKQDGLEICCQVVC